jgi:hypothetical protein
MNGTRNCDNVEWEDGDQHWRAHVTPLRSS